MQTSLGSSLFTKHQFWGIYLMNKKKYKVSQITFSCIGHRLCYVSKKAYNFSVWEFCFRSLRANGHVSASPT